MATASKTPPGADPKQLERTGTVREIGSQAVWSLSSCKPGFGVDQLRDDNLETYWQSDGSQPHLVNIQFRRKTTVKMLCIYADYKSDESYTPSKISVRVGNNFHNLQEIRSDSNGRVGLPRPPHRRPTATSQTPELAQDGQEGGWWAESGDRGQRNPPITSLTLCHSCSASLHNATTVPPPTHH
ncbi:hypothetical protein AAFF_G00349440 [Aldrovandia affinis]|uniref:Anaphase-promoting complex subunit 10 n=1 Tax=Aldrovandia affinis TaxID=143900 RepID=A0AAD7WNW6_9TELE|nr:hypothetical protein AAFF_G00349440 [Aldrovandia affinis]